MATTGPQGQRLHFTNSRLRTSWLSFLILLVSGVFASAPFAIDPAVHCVEYPCPWWLRGFVVALGLVFGLGILVGMLRDHQTGSFLDLQTRELVWWDSHPPLTQQRIAIDDVQRIAVDTSSETDKVRLLLRGGTTVPVPAHCLHTPYREWCASVSGINPSIEVNIT